MKLTHKMILTAVGSTLCIAANAALFDRGSGIIYDSDTNLTWLQDWNLAKTSGYDSDGLMTWNAAMAWAEQLQHAGYSDWRLPIYTNPSNEMYHVWHDELGNIINNPTSNRGQFLIPQSGDYWLGTVYRSGEAFAFTLRGNQSNGSFTHLLYATAVRVGDVSPIPEPTTLVQLIAGLVVLGSLASRGWRPEA